jgi:cobalamin biosynthesis Mg chelatase CobN
VSTNITVKTKIRVNGVEYSSVEGMPADVREAYERVLSTLGTAKHKGLVEFSATARDAPGGSNATIVFNGQEFSSVDQMPADVRHLYDGVMATLDAERAAVASGPGPSGPAQSIGRGRTSSLLVQASSVTSDAVRPESTSARLVIAGIVIAALLLGSLWFGR